MAGHSADEIRAETRKYVMVFVALAALTVVTVAVSYLDLSIGAAVVLAMIIAAAKGSLVAAYFMHLIAEESLIYAILGLTAIFFLVLMLLPVYQHAGYIGG